MKTDSPTSSLRKLALRAGLFGALLVLGNACAVIQPIRDPVMQLLRRGACISVDIPPITLTPERTAAERQLIGTEGEVEKEGWLIASAQSAGTGTEGVAGTNDLNEIEIENRRYHIEAGVLDYYHPIVLKYRRSELLGESYDGQLRMVPPNLSRSRFSEESDMAAEVAREVNRARQWIHDYALREASQNGALNGEERERLRERHVLRWYNEAQKLAGEWLYTERKQWVRSR